MYLKNIKLQNFRNYHQLILEPAPGANYIYGKNAQGKTNILESIYYLLSGHSFRTRYEKELISWETSFLRIQGEVEDHGNQKKVKIFFSHPSHKKIEINGKEVKRENFFPKFPVIVFHPEDLNLIKDGPLIRRKFLNREISRLYPAYWQELKNYYRVLKQRNKYLKGVPDKKGTLDLWNDQLATYGSKLVYLRLIFLDKLEKYFSPLVDFFTSGQEHAHLHYSSNINVVEYFNEISLEHKSSVESSIYKKIYAKLREKQPEELKRGYSLAGPHLDDFAVLLNGRDSQKYSSQGQQRTIILSLKLAQLELFRINHKTPLLLLDDVFSELDQQRRKHIIRFIEKKGMQCFITSHENNFITSTAGFPVSVFKLEKGVMQNEPDWKFA